jgi:hypothetical protein
MLCSNEGEDTGGRSRQRVVLTRRPTELLVDSNQFFGHWEIDDSRSMAGGKNDVDVDAAVHVLAPDDAAVASLLA